MLAYFIRGLILGLPAAAQPGPFQAYLLSQSLKNGWRRTLPAALAPLLSDGPIVALVLLVLTQLPPTFLSLLQIVGGLFILYLAWGAWGSFRHFQPPTAAPTDATRQSVLEASVMNLLNPNPYLFWSAVGGPILLEGWRASRRARHRVPARFLRHLARRLSAADRPLWHGGPPGAAHQPLADRPFGAGAWGVWGLSAVERGKPWIIERR